MKKIFYITAAAAALSAAPALAATPVNGAFISGSSDIAAPAGSTSVIRFNFAGDANNNPANPGADGSSTGPRYFSTGGEAAAQNIAFSGQGNIGRVPYTMTSPFGENPPYTFAAPSPSDFGFFGVGGATSDGTESFASFSGTATNPGFSSISAYFGSINNFNVVQLFYNGVEGFDTFNGEQLLSVLPGQSLDGNGRVTFTARDGLTFSGVRFFNNEGIGRGSFEFDNLAFTAAAVPEPATWAMMLLGFGMVAGAARYRRRSTNVRFA